MAKSESRIRSVLTSESFLEKAFLLFLSGLIVPMVIILLKGQYEQSQKVIEADKARQVSMLDARRKFWEEASTTILTYETLALDVSWFKTSPVQDEAMHKVAFERYNREIVGLVSRWRVLISRASTLASPGVAQRLSDLLREALTNQDTPIAKLVRANAQAADWDQQHQSSQDTLTRANALIAEIAVELELAAKR